MSASSAAVGTTQSAVVGTTQSAVVGYVEALTTQVALGWAWCPGHPDRLRVELHLAGQVVAHAIADLARDDLARSGIGDGHHAFSLPLPEHADARSPELRVVAYPIQGPAVPLEPPPAVPAAAASLAPLQRGIETLISSQRLLHRNLQAALLQQSPPATSTLAEIAAAQAQLNQTIATVELFVVRLETALQGREQPAVATPPRPIVAAAVAISCLAFIASCWAVYHVTVGG